MIATAIIAPRLPRRAWITCRQTSGPTPPHHRGPGSREVPHFAQPRGEDALGRHPPPPLLKLLADAGGGLQVIGVQADGQRVNAGDHRRGQRRPASASGNSRSAAMTLAKTVKGASTISAAGECLARSSVVSSMPSGGGLAQHHGGRGEHAPEKQPPGTGEGVFAHRLADKLAQSVRLLITSEARKNPAAAAGQE